VDVDVALFEEVTRDAEPLAFVRRTRARLGPIPSDVTELPVSWSFPVPYMRVASMKRSSADAGPRQTGRNTGLLGSFGDFAGEALRAEELADLSSSSILAA